MAADEVLLQTAADGIASLRFYGWQMPTVSLGYFQNAQECLAHRRLSELSVVRRATGGATLVHHRELTYALALPGDPSWLGGTRRGESWPGRMHQIIASTLRHFGVHLQLCQPGQELKKGPVLCFLHQTPDDLLLAGHKVVGSAQRKWKNALLQHGGILLEQSPHTPELPGLRELSQITISPTELAQALQREFADQLGWQLVFEDWSESERESIANLQSTRYAHPAWTFKR